jgi:hypothetical protein
VHRSGQFATLLSPAGRQPTPILTGRQCCTLPHQPTPCASSMWLDKCSRSPTSNSLQPCYAGRNFTAILVHTTGHSQTAQTILTCSQLIHGYSRTGSTSGCRTSMITVNEKCLGPSVPIWFRTSIKSINRFSILGIVPVVLYFYSDPKSN